jgi:uncharacterized membrane protein YqjE
MNDTTSSGLLGAWKRVGALTLATVRARVELFAVECQEEKWRLILALSLTAAAIALGAVTLVLLTITVVLMFWENGRLPALCVMSALFALATILILRTLYKMRTSEPGFRGTIGELKKDCACLLPHD